MFYESNKELQWLQLINAINIFNVDVFETSYLVYTNLLVSLSLSELSDILCTICDALLDTFAIACVVDFPAVIFLAATVFAGPFFKDGGGILPLSTRASFAICVNGVQKSSSLSVSSVIIITHLHGSQLGIYCNALLT